jgi:AcrR family transcriptional regulator
MAHDAIIAAPVSDAWRRPPDLELTPILSGALDAFYENGYHGTSVRDIARRVDLTVPALYYHHENKEALLLALLTRSIDRVHSLCLEARAAGRSPEERYLNLVECMVLFMCHSTKIAFIDREIRALSPANYEAYSRKRRSVEQMMEEAINEGVEAGIFDVSAPRDTARALVGMIQFVAAWFRPGGRLSAQAVAYRYLDIGAHMVGAKPDMITRLRARIDSV